MSTDLQNFRAWYANVLAGLYGNRDAGLAIFMLSLPLAERYLRQRAGVGPDDLLDDRFMDELVRLFPVLADALTARDFWAAYRHGFLHQATLSCVARSGRSLRRGALTHDAPDALVVASDEFCVNPVLFSQRIIGEIESNFVVFVGAGTSAPPLPQTVVQVSSGAGLAIPPATISTKGGP